MKALSRELRLALEPLRVGVVHVEEAVAACGSQKLARALRACPADGNREASRRVSSGIGSTDAYSASAA
jgi:hypothetical protein